MLLMQNVSPSNGESTTIADHEVNEEELQAGHRKWKGKRKGIGRTRRERYSLLYIAAHEGCINRDKWLTAKSMHKCQRNMVSQGTITKV